MFSWIFNTSDSTGIKQANNIAPILFIIVIQFLAELMEKMERKQYDDTSFSSRYYHVL